VRTFSSTYLKLKNSALFKQENVLTFTYFRTFWIYC